MQTNRPPVGLGNREGDSEELRFLRKLFDAERDEKLLEFDVPERLFYERPGVDPEDNVLTMRAIGRIEDIYVDDQRRQKVQLRFTTKDPHESTGKRLMGEVKYTLQHLMEKNVDFIDNPHGVSVEKIRSTPREKVAELLARGPNPQPPAGPPPPVAQTLEQHSASLVQKVEGNPSGTLLVFKMPLEKFTKKKVRTVKGANFVYCAAQFLKRDGAMVQWKIHPLEKLFGENDQEGSYNTFTGSISAENMGKYDPELLYVPQKTKSGKTIEADERVTRFIEKRLRDWAAAKSNNDERYAKRKVKQPRQSGEAS